MTISKESVERSFTRAASTYEKFTFFQKQSVDDFAAFLRSGARKVPARILEAGCGTGQLTARLHAIFPDAALFSTDISRGMIELCRSKFAENGKLVFQCHDFDLPYPASGFDMAVSSLSLQWSSDLPTAFSNLADALAPDGELFLSLPLAESLPEVREVFRNAGAEFHGLSLPGKEEVLKALSVHFKGVVFQVRTYHETYSSLHELLRSMRLNGTSGGNSGTSVSVLKKLLRNDSTSSFTTTYHILSLTGKRKKT